MASTPAADDLHSDDYVKLREMINKHIIYPIQQQEGNNNNTTFPRNHGGGSSAERGSGGGPPSAVTYKNLISLLLPTAQEFHNIRKRKQDDEGREDEATSSRPARRPTVAALDTELDWQPGIRTHSPKTPTPPTLQFKERKGESDGKVFCTGVFRRSLTPSTKESLRALELFRGICICNFMAMRLVSDGSGRPAVRVPITRTRHIELLLDTQMPLKSINIKGEIHRINIGTLWLLMASRSLTSQTDLQRCQRLVREIADKFNLDVLDSAKERQLLLAYLTGRSGLETIVRSSLWCPIEEGVGMENDSKEERRDSKKARVDPGDSCSIRADAAGRRIVIEEKLSALKEQLKEAHKLQQQQQASAAAAKANPAISRAVAALVQKTRIQAAVSSGYRAEAEGDGIAAPETPSSSGHDDENRPEKALPLITSDVVAAVSSDNPELIALEVELEAKLQLQKQILIEYYRVSDMLRMERELVTCYQRRGKHLEIEKTKALTMLLEHTKGAEVDADLKQCQLAVTPRTLKAQDDRLSHRQETLTVQSLHM